MTNPNELKAVLLSEATTEQQRQFAEMLAEQCAKADLKAKGHVCWFNLPSSEECENLKKYYNQPCPKCKKGRVVCEVFKCSLTGDNLWLKCRHGEPGCDFKEFASVLED